MQVTFRTRHFLTMGFHSKRVHPARFPFMAAASLALAAIAFFALPTLSHAAGLSNIKVTSALGQPFVAEVMVTGLQADDYLTAQARMATHDEYEAAKLSVTPAVRQIRATMEPGDTGKIRIKLTSFSPINEPALDLMVDFSWRGGRLMQKYSVLLDPAK